jgi:threonine aldolase
VVAGLETEVAGLLGMPAAVYLPSGIMAQQAALRVHADRRAGRTVVFHPQSHLDVHEGRALERLQGLVGRPAGDRDRLLLRADLDAVAESPAALVVELPQRDLGGQLPPWDDLTAQTAWAGDRGVAAHLDVARLWEASAGYERSPAEIAGLFDTAYVSFYKGIGALAGCCLAGPDDVVAEVREWRRRLGGTLFGLWPGAASALSCLRRRLPLMPAYLQRAREIAEAVRDLPGVTVVPGPPQTPMLHLLLRTDPERFGSPSAGWPRAVCGPGSGRCRPSTRASSGSSSRSATPRWRCPSPRSGWRSPRSLRPRAETHVSRVTSTPLRSVVAHERQRQAPGWLPGNLYSV